MMTKKEIEREVARLEERQPWWHDIELPHSVRTRGIPEVEIRENHNVPKWNKIKPFVDAAGKRVIDIGCNEGFYCLKMLESGASHVLGVDINPFRIEKARFVLDVTGSKGVELLQESVYGLDPDKVGRFDLAFCLGLLHRVPDPFTAIQVVSSLADTAVFEWVALGSDEPVMHFWVDGHKDYDTHNSGYWKISRRCARDMMWRNGFTHYIDIEQDHPRAIMLAVKSAAGLEGYRSLDPEEQPARSAVQPPAPEPPAGVYRRVRRALGWLIKGR